MEEKRINSRAVTSSASMLNLNLVLTSLLMIIYQLCSVSDKNIQTYLLWSWKINSLLRKKNVRFLKLSTIEIDPMKWFSGQKDVFQQWSIFFSFYSNNFLLKYFNYIYFLVTFLKKPKTFFSPTFILKFRYLGFIQIVVRLTRTRVISNPEFKIFSTTRKSQVTTKNCFIKTKDNQNFIL